jgi:MFS family permease
MLMSMVETPWQYYLVFGGMVGMARYLIQIAHNVIPKWFVRKRGPAMAWASAGSGIGPLIFPYPIQFLISTLGWRDAWLILGILALALLVLGSLVIHTSPEDVGLHPDGDPPPSDNNHPQAAGVRATAVQEYSYTRHEALRTQFFWMVLIGVTLGTLGMNGFNPTIVPFLHDRDFSPEIAALSVSAYASVAILMRFGWGFMTTRMTARHAFMLQCSIAGFAVLFLYFVLNAPMLILAMMLLGFGFGGFWVLQGVMIADYFGRRHIAGVRGIIQPFQTIAGSGGPLLFGLIFDFSGTYAWVFGVAIAAWALSVVATYFSRPRKAPIATTNAPTA